jgi:hypothetical protein
MGAGGDGDLARVGVKAKAGGCANVGGFVDVATILVVMRASMLGP